MKISDAKIAVVGATGLVGSSVLGLMEEWGMIPSRLALFASERSAGSRIAFSGDSYEVAALDEKRVAGFDAAIFAAGSTVSAKWAPVFVDGGAVVIDKSSAWRADANCPLVIPEVNGEELESLPKGIIASPNCSTIGFVLAIEPLIRAFGEPEIVFVSTYQAVSGAGKDGSSALERQRRGDDYIGPFATRIFGNLIPLIGRLGPNGFNEEENKLSTETRKILRMPDLNIVATAVRVPVDNGHSAAVSARFKREVKLAKAERILRKAPCVEFLSVGEMPSPAIATGSDNVFVGRVRITPDDRKTLSLFISFDNLRRGAATNAVELLSRVLEEKKGD